jgi:hypothetical protein
VGLSDERFDRMVEVLEGIRGQLERIADHLSATGVETRTGDRDVKHKELAGYVEGLPPKEVLGFSTVGMDAKIWRVLVQTLLGNQTSSIEKILVTPIPLTRLREGFASGKSAFRNMGGASWQIFTGFMEAIS